MDNGTSGPSFRNAQKSALVAPKPTNWRMQAFWRRSALAVADSYTWIACTRSLRA